MEKLTAEQVTKSCAQWGFFITKEGFAQYLADLCNEPLRVPPIPLKAFEECPSQLSYFFQGRIYSWSLPLGPVVASYVADPGDFDENVKEVND